MNLIGVDVNHKVFGAGVVVNVDESNSRVDVQFKDGTRTFAFPQGFVKFLTVKDENIKTELDSLIAEDNRKRQEEEAVKAAEWEKKIEQ